MKAVKVTCNGESKIVVATSNDLNAFMANICSTFNVPNISNLKLLGCAVNTSTFPAVICEQSVEMTVEVSSFIDISNSYPLNGFLAHLEDFNNSERNQINSAVNTDQHISFNPSLNYQSQSSLKSYSACSTTSLTNISIETESGTELVADSSSCNRPQITKRKILKVPFPEAGIRSIEEYFNFSVIEYLNGKSISINNIEKQLKTSLINYCRDFLPQSNDKWVRREFFTRLKSSMISRFPLCMEDWDKLLGLIANTLRQQQWTKSNKASPKFGQLSKSKKSSSLLALVNSAEPVLSKEQLLHEVEIELQKNKPSTQVLAILNRNLFEPQIFKSIPIRLQLTPSLLISEFCRLYPMFADFESNSKEFCNLVFSDGSVFLNLIKFQSDVSCKKSSSNAFHVTQSDNLDEMLGVSIPGPQVVFNETHFMICSRNGCELKKAQISSASEVFCCIIAIYYLMDLTYPSSYAQTLGVLQEIILKDTFLHKSHKATNYLKNMVY
ncbi:uncharacterized protein LOC136092806 [Hydra vulgaris]|uniref:uncharacterized protein LOC136092806 n=1 Tax=Hydra vulgaris TaxID=6087 RepID=UPI0032EA710B